MSNQLLAGKTALITGASRGIGRAIALTFAGCGASVMINYSGSEERAKETVQEIEALGGHAALCKADVSNAEEVQRLITETVHTMGQIDILVNNAGITRDNLLLRMTEEEFDRVLSVNLKGAFLCLKEASKYMIRQRSGRIINISSICGVVGNAGQANYCAAKAGLIGLTKSAAKELASRGITVNAIAPGYIATDMTDVLSEKIREEAVKTIPLKRFGSPEDIAHAAAYLASDYAGYVTGQVIGVNGGLA